MSLLNRSPSAIDKTFSATGKAKSLNPDAAEFVPFALRSPSGNTSAADTSSSFSNFGTGTTGKSILDRSESSVSNNSEDEAHQFWRHQLPDDIIPDFNAVGEEESQGINSISFSKLSIADVNGTSRFLPSNQRELSPRQINGRSIAENMRYSLPAYGRSPSAPNVQQMRAKPWDIHGDQMLAGIIDGPPYNGDSGQGYLNGMLNEQQMEATEINSLEFLASQFPGFEVESLAEVYYANGCDLSMTIEMLTQLEVDNGMNQNLKSKALSAPNISALDFPALSPTDNKNNVPTFSPRDQQQSLNSYPSLEKELLMFKSSSTSPSLGATDFASAVRKLASQDSGIWKYDKSPSPNSTIGSSRSSHASGYGGGGRASYGDRLANRSSSRSSPVWLETGDAVANMYSEMRGEARDHARLRNTYFEQALAWRSWREKREAFGYWDMSKASVLDRFQLSQAAPMQQTGTVREYVSQFEQMAAQLDGIPESVVIGSFIKGLKSDVRTAVRLLQPRGITQTNKLAIMVDEDSDAKLVSKDESRDVIAELSVAAGDPTQTKRLTDAELAEKRAKGLCFRCDGKFGPRHRGHRCPEKSEGSSGNSRTRGGGGE